MERNDVGSRKHVWQRVVRTADLARERVVRVQVKREDIHTEALGDTDHVLTYLPRADDADGPAVEVEAGQSLRGECSLHDAFVRGQHLPRECEEEGESVFGNRVLAVGGYGRHRDAPLTRKREVDMVVPCRARRDEP